jgi:hypothetical protein
MKYNFRVYIPFAENIPLLNECIDSLIPQLQEFSEWGELNDTWMGSKKIVVINNSPDNSISHLLHHTEAVDVWRLPFVLSHADEGNWMIADALNSGQPFCMTIHTDASLLPGAMEWLLKKYEDVKDSKWSVLMSPHGGHIFCAYNVEFFKQEQVWFDPFLFPFYFMDNHMGRIMMLRGWKEYLADNPTRLVNHKSSHFLKENPIFCQKNNIAFKHHGAIYSEIWQGPPGHERSADIYANGTLPKKDA